MERLELLKRLSFGAQVAEDEAQELANYFVETHQWDQIATGKKDIIRGEKGAGKSAIYSLLSTKTDEFFSNGILIVPADRPRGTTVFKDLVADPPTTEQEFTWLAACAAPRLVRTTISAAPISPPMPLKWIGAKITAASRMASNTYSQPMPSRSIRFRLNGRAIGSGARSMSHDLAVAALLKTYSDLQGELAAIRKKDAEICRKLDHVRGTLWIYRPDMKLDAISPTRPTKPRKVTPRGGKQSRLALEVLKEATEPLTSREVVRLVLERQGYEEPDERLIGIVVPNVHGALNRFKKKGVVNERGSPKRWEIVR